MVETLPSVNHMSQNFLWSELTRQVASQVFRTTACRTHPKYGRSLPQIDLVGH